MRRHQHRRSPQKVSQIACNSTICPQPNQVHQHLYEMLKQGSLLEKLQEVVSPFRLPIDLTLRTIGCDGVCLVPPTGRQVWLERSH
jgi:hypothetical protein